MSKVKNERTLRNLLLRLSFEEKSLLNVYHDEIPKILLDLWFQKYDFEFNTPKIIESWGESGMKIFLKMVRWNEINYLKVSLDHLKDLYMTIMSPCYSIRDCDLYPQLYSATPREDWELLALMDLMPNLLKLTIFFDIKENFMVRCQRLRSLTLYKKISLQHVNRTLTRCKHLRQLNLFDDKLALELDVVRLANIRSLGVSVNMFKHNSEKLKKMKHLSSLCITFIERAFADEWIRIVNDYVLSPPREIGLLLISGKNLTKFDVNKLNFGELQEIMLADMPTLKNEEVVDLVKRNPNMRDLLLKNCPNLSAEMLWEIEDIKKSLNKKFNFYFEDCEKVKESLRRTPFESDYINILRDGFIPPTTYQNFLKGLNVAEILFIPDQHVVRLLK